LPLPGESVEQFWWQLPAEARTDVLTLLARLIARGVVIDADSGSGDG
jgi:hypothetical protein